ncbi:hypothetical protein COCNU_06G013770 [Cocos nucifera]|uniref:Tetratricopeptide repeat protein 38 n=1 Tax=Cocos nucifera TaxID=13894 RepID=A0A8K0IC08_COCNU|nr:hypothetical protein COCNU_06G013770 [Cocos nucifera]
MDGENAATATRSDRWGQPVRTTSDACIAAVDSYYEQFLSYGRNRAVILQAPLHDPSCVLANALAADFLASKNHSKASTLLAAAASSLENSTSYEKAVFRAISCLVGDEKDDDTAVERHMELLREFPKDLVSLKRAQLLCFYMGRADLSLNLVEQVLPQNENESYIYGMLAFPLLELGKMSEAEKAARKGFDINKHDLWSQHNVYLNALGLLMRVYVRDHMGYIEDRLLMLADRLEDKSIWHMEWLLDLSALWALASINKIHKAEDLLKSMKSRIYSVSRKKQHTMQRGILVGIIYNSVFLLIYHVSKIFRFTSAFV